MQSIEDLSGLSELEFERRRSQILSDHIKSLPEDRRKQAYALQLQLDLKRAKMGSEEFMKHCLREATANLETIGSQFEVLQAKMGLNPPSLPDYTNERKAQI
jgi:hypothetical protein